ncbi:MAG: hypothetical protein R2734_02625 [Nocardioides sp.]
MTLEQVTYFRPTDPRRTPWVGCLWIWMDEPCFYGFPSYGEPTTAARAGLRWPRGGPRPPHRGPRPRPGGSGCGTWRGSCPVPEPVDRSVRCQYTLTHDRDFLLDTVPGTESVVVGLAAGHGFKFAPHPRATAGRPGRARRGYARPDAVPLRASGTDRPGFEPQWMV